MRFKGTAVSYSIVNDTAERIKNCIAEFAIIDTAEQPTRSNIFANSKLYSKRLQPVHQGPKGSYLMTKTEVENLCQRHFKAENFMHQIIHLVCVPFICERQKKH
jgi:hypothetical protein